MRKQRNEPFEEAAREAVLIYVEVLKLLDFACNGAQILQRYGHSQCQPGHTGRESVRERGERIPT